MFPSLVGRPYAEARRSFDSAVLCGVLDEFTAAHESPKVDGQPHFDKSASR